MKKIYGTLIDRTMKIIRSTYTETFKRIGADITTEQWVILDALYHEDSQSLTGLSEGIYKNVATVSRIIDLMTKKGLVKKIRTSSDKRRYSIALTAKGQKLFEKVEPEVKRLRTSGWKGLSEKDYEAFKMIIDKVYANFKH